tara:strand:- start:329 stop:559 length:231 start_codon:yes stop_codon:yes gene_type:complete
MRMMNTIVKDVPNVITINIIKNYIPCSLSCYCVRTLNIKNSYMDRFLYKRCYSEKKKYMNLIRDEYVALNKGKEFK